MPYMVGRLTNPAHRSAAKKRRANPRRASTAQQSLNLEPPRSVMADEKTDASKKKNRFKKLSKADVAKLGEAEQKEYRKQLSAASRKRIERVKKQCAEQAEKSKKAAVSRALAQANKTLKEKGLPTFSSRRRNAGLTESLMSAGLGTVAATVGTVGGGFVSEKVGGLIDGKGGGALQLLGAFACHFLAQMYGGALQGAAGAALVSASSPMIIGAIQSFGLDVPGVTMFGPDDDDYDMDGYAYQDSMQGVEIGSSGMTGVQIGMGEANLLTSTPNPAMSGTVNLAPTFAYGQLLGRA